MKKLHKFIAWYPHNFIQECWGEGNLANHLQSKFEMFYNMHGSWGALPAFISSLDSGNEAQLFEYIDNTFNEDGSRKA